MLSCKAHVKSLNLFCETCVQVVCAECASNDHFPPIHFVRGVADQPAPRRSSEQAHKTYAEKLEALEKASWEAHAALFELASFSGTDVVMRAALTAAVKSEPPCVNAMSCEVTRCVRDDVLLLEPWGITALSDDVIAVVSEGGHRVHMYSVSAQVCVRSIGLGLGTSDTHDFSYPMCVAAVTPHIVVVSDSGNHRVCVWRWVDGMCLRCVGTMGSDVGQFHHPQGVASVTSDTFATADRDNHRIQFFRWMDGVFLKCIGKGGKGSGPQQFNSPQELAFVASDTMVISDVGNGRLQIVQWMDGIFLRSVAAPWGPTGVALVGEGILAVTDRTSHAVRFLCWEDGSCVRSVGNSQFDFPAAIAVVGGKMLVVVDHKNNRWCVVE